MEMSNGSSPKDWTECAFLNELSDVYGYQPTVNFIAMTSRCGKGDSLSGSRKGENNKIVSLVPGSCTSGTKRSLPDKMTTPSQRLKTARGKVQMRWCHGWMSTRRGNSI